MRTLGRHNSAFSRAVVGATAIAVIALPAGGVARAAPKDTSVHTVQVGNISIAYRQVGHGRPLLLIQGSGAAMDVWWSADRSQRSPNITEWSSSTTGASAPPPTTRRSR